MDAVPQDQNGRPFRTLLEQLIRTERGETFEEFAEYAEVFGRRNGLHGTLSVRHLQRLISGRKPDGSPIGAPRPATATLLERIFGVPAADLLSPPRRETVDHAEMELRQRLSASRHVDGAVIDLLREQLNALRRLDRQMGAIVAYDEVREKLEQVRHLHTYSTTPSVRAALAGVLSELGALAGWEALDRYQLRQAWEHHELAKRAAREANSSGLLAHATAQQAFILSELNEVRSAVVQLAEARNLVQRTAPGLLRAWLAAAHGEGLAAGLPFVWILPMCSQLEVNSAPLAIKLRSLRDWQPISARFDNSAGCPSMILNNREEYTRLLRRCFERLIQPLRVRCWCSTSNDNVGTGKASVPSS